MAMCFKQTGNLDVIKDWVLGLTEPYDRNNAGETEADNLGQALYLISLFAGTNHPRVPRILKELPRFEVAGGEGKYLKSRSDFAEHPAYQTKWAKFGLTALELPDPYVVPQGRTLIPRCSGWISRTPTSRARTLMTGATIRISAGPATIFTA